MGTLRTSCGAVSLFSLIRYGKGILTVINSKSYKSFQQETLSPEKRVQIATFQVLVHKGMGNYRGKCVLMFDTDMLKGLF